MTITVDTYEIFEEDFTPEMVSILTYLCERYKSRMIGKEVLVGRNRNVFILPGKIVVKIPTCLDGFTDNDWEGSISNLDDDPEEIRYARTRLCYYKDVPIVFMEYVEFIEYVEFATSREIKMTLGHEPDWTYSVDGGQVGFNSKGKLVAFDYGIK